MPRHPPSRPLSDSGTLLPSARLRDHAAPHKHAHKPPGQDAQLHQMARPSPAAAGELTLLPGQYYFGNSVPSINTLLGSCVAITLWHPERRIGGMCHFLLPSRQHGKGLEMDGRYGDEAIAAMLAAIAKSATQPTDYHAHLYGGADTMPDADGPKLNVGERNIEQGWRLIDTHGFQLQGVDVGENVPRRVCLQLHSGLVTMRRCPGHPPLASKTPPRKR